MFLPIFFSFNNKNTKICWNPFFIVFLLSSKKENFQKINLKHWKLKKKKNQYLHPFFEKGYF